MDKESTNILCPRDQLRLFGYRNYFNSFNKLFKNRKLPNVILLSGLKGIGKATLIYNFVFNIFKDLYLDKMDQTNLIYNNSHPNIKYIWCNFIILVETTKNKCIFWQT